MYRVVVGTRGAANLETSFDTRFGEQRVEDAGLIGTIWAGLGMASYFMALTWINMLLGHMLSPLFVIPLSWFRSKQGGRAS